MLHAYFCDCGVVKVRGGYEENIKFHNKLGRGVAGLLSLFSDPTMIRNAQ
jgi:hypothetical protein